MGNVLYICFMFPKEIPVQLTGSTPCHFEDWRVREKPQVKLTGDKTKQKTQ